ncbi:MAG TPA: CreA family protein [Woeseiaceae bacterium]|nr:CreA family protein [Woeseiaceae bacterium]
MRATLNRLLRVTVALTVCCCSAVFAEEIGSVDTRLRPLSPDDSIKIEAVPDPDVGGVVCYVSRAEVGGYSGALGLAEDTSDASIDCRQVGPITIEKAFKPGEGTFRERRSLIFKSLRVIRFCDVKHNTIVYLIYSEKLIDGSPKNSISAVPIRPWPGQADPVARCRYEK